VRDEKHYKLLFFEMLEEKLMLVGSQFNAEVAKIDHQVHFYHHGMPVTAGQADQAFLDSLTRIAWERYLIASRYSEPHELPQPPPLPDGIVARLEPTRYHVQVEGFSKLGIISAEDAPPLERGSVVPVRLRGFNLTTMRFQFEGLTL
jgi:hypothetical protein